jgi:23S rRNA pseudouridine1911/1915/1917 synthase
VKKPERENIIAMLAAKKDAGERIDRFLAAHAGDLSRSRLKQLLLDGEVRVGDGTVKDPAYRVKSGDRIELHIPVARPAKPKGENIPLNVVFEDDQLIVIDKPAGLVVHPAAGNEDGTLVNALIAHCGSSLSGIGGEKRPGIVHRLDKDTSGLLVVAKTDKAHRKLSEQFADHGRTGPLLRGYLAFVWGVPDPRRGTVDLKIGRDPKSREKMAVVPNGKRAVTRYALLGARNACPSRASSSAGWRPAARTRSAYTSRGSAIPFSAIRSMAPATNRRSHSSARTPGACSSA